VIVEVSVGDSNPLSSVSDVKKTIQVILAGAEISREIAMIDPDVGGLINTNGITIIGINLTNLEVTQDDIADLTDIESDASNGCERLTGAQLWLQLASRGKHAQLPDSP
jgi:hypothetical protein